MEPDQKPAAGGEPQQGRRIPNSDMQAEDAGTAESGNEDEGRSSASESAMKETDKTDKESGGSR
ncbi:hypothetical protein EZ313_13910 [Ramlibacter henchirensis]|uniref:Uncharacterized protein n=1 Tax=Ramlibacter henchirensis TaxID=204072 RepID=A0A4Z0BWI3_9BURK|nr:hypothetical protein [Ramlibacter henchirensis]TFZ02359.1 hypothetical protein EZ313_13910 [Ramlibacter henchirensis]